VKICYIIPNLNLGGAQTQVVMQANALSQQGIETQLIILGNEVPLLSEVNENVSVEVLGFRGVNKVKASLFRRLLLTKAAVTKKVNSFEPTHILAVLQSAHFVARIAKNNFSTSPKLWVYHRSTEYAQSPINSLPKQFFHILNCQLGKKHDYGHIHISNAVKEDIEAHFPTKNSHVLYNAVPNQNITEEQVAEAIALVAVKKNYIIIPGRLHPVKGHLFFLKATHNTLKDEGINIVIAGYGPMEQQIKQTTHALGIEKQVTITGKLQNIELLALMKGAIFVVIPSLEEGLGNVAIEALMLGKTVLSSNAGGLKEVIHDSTTGYVFNKGDEIDLSNKFSQLITNTNMLLNENFLTTYYKEQYLPDNQIVNLLSILNT